MSRNPVHEYRALDAFRFLAAAMVAVGHFDSGFQLGLEKFTPIATRFSLFVDFFFILSGFVITLNYDGRIASLRSYGDFMWRRFARLWPLHLAVLIFFGSLGLAGYLVGYSFNHPDTMRVSALPWNLLLLHAWGPVWHQSFNVASWSISAEMFVYALFPVLAWQARRWPITANLILVAGFVIVMSLARDAAGLRPWNQATYDLGALRAVPSFMLGVLIHRVTLPGGWSPKISWPMAHGVFILAVAAIHFMMPAELIIALFGTFVFATVKAEQQQPDTWLAGSVCHDLGQASYALYMVHMPMMTCGMVIARRTTGLGGVSGWIFATVILALALVLALWLFKGFEDPWRKKLNGLSPFTKMRVQTGKFARAEQFKQKIA